MAPRFIQTSVTLSPLLVALASIASLELQPSEQPASADAGRWQACQVHRATGRTPGWSAGERTQWPGWLGDAQAEVERCLRDQVAPPLTARQPRQADGPA